MRTGQKPTQTDLQPTPTQGAYLKDFFFFLHAVSIPLIEIWGVQSVRSLVTYTIGPVPFGWECVGRGGGGGAVAQSVE